MGEYGDEGGGGGGGDGRLGSATHALRSVRNRSKSSNIIIAMATKLSLQLPWQRNIMFLLIKLYEHFIAILIIVISVTN